MDADGVLEGSSNSEWFCGSCGEKVRVLSEYPCAVCGQPRRGPLDGVDCGTGLAHHRCHDPLLWLRRVLALTGAAMGFLLVFLPDHSALDVELLARWLACCPIAVAAFVLANSKRDLWNLMTGGTRDEISFFGFGTLILVYLVGGAALLLLGAFLFSDGT